MARTGNQTIRRDRMEFNQGHDFAEGRYRDAQLRDRADAIRANVSGGRCGAYRATYGCEGAQFSCRGCADPISCASGVLWFGNNRTAFAILGGLPAESMARAAILVVDDVDAPST